MKLIINNKIPFAIILLCFVLENCLVHPHVFQDTPTSEDKPTPHHSQHMANPPDQADHHNKNQADPTKHHSSFPPSQAPHSSKSTSSDDDDHSSSSSFSAAFSDILKGSLGDKSLIIPQHPFSETKQSSLSIEQICTHTDYPDVCIATIQPLLTHNFDVTNVLEASIKACMLQMKLTITKVAKHTAKSPEIANAVGECKNQYANALENLQKAMDAIRARDLGTVTVMLSAVMADVSTCESTFEDLKAPSSPLSKTDGLVSITVSNCLSIANLIPYSY